MPETIQELIRFLRHERRLNQNRKSRFLITQFRLAQYFNNKRLFNPFRRIILLHYQFVSEWIAGCEIPPSTSVGLGFRIFHPSGIAINHLTVIGMNVTIRQNTTIGHKFPEGACPKIGNNVDIGANVCIIGNILIEGDNSIGAGSVVVHDVKSGRTVAGNPAKQISQDMATS